MSDGEQASAGERGPRDSAQSGLIPGVCGPEGCVPGVKSRHVLYPTQYVWYVLVSSLDLIVTNTVMTYFGAREVNTIADKAIKLFDFWGLIGLKFASVVLVVGICEYIGRRRPALGKKIAEWAVAISAVPVVVGIVQAIVHNVRG